MMKDPGSIQFGPVATYKTDSGYEIVCQRYNAKNSFGAYAGEDIGFVRLSSGKIVEVKLGVPQGSYRCGDASRGGGEFRY
jgi:hypothetical protein